MPTRLHRPRPCALGTSIGSISQRRDDLKPREDECLEESHSDEDVGEWATLSGICPWSFPNYLSLGAPLTFPGTGAFSSQSAFCFLGFFFPRTKACYPNRHAPGALKGSYLSTNKRHSLLNRSPHATEMSHRDEPAVVCVVISLMACF